MALFRFVFVAAVVQFLFVLVAAMNRFGIPRSQLFRPRLRARGQEPHVCKPPAFVVRPRLTWVEEEANSAACLLVPKMRSRQSPETLLDRIDRVDAGRLYTDDRNLNVITVDSHTQRIP
ncbi:hypothetical protein [Williamsia sp. DF01-3]|uniref:hypothetical protein n=1 Tax=Williamsia sp. DF01-3 TaxID=2934157 RepID=UPI001FF57AA9|nr:hypothetical protein [Williamsia sp. DF01-3]MCK0517397.1 hypothetical protein [Williamsia sp. DF01-3]